MATIEELINNAVTFSTDAVTDAQQAINRANNEANRLSVVDAVRFSYENTLVEPKFRSGIGDFLDAYVPPQNNANVPVFTPIFIPDRPVFPDAPILKIDNLFEIERPLYDVAPFNEKEPEIDIQGLKEDVDAIPQPNIPTVDQPVITRLNLDPVPDVALPVFTATKDIDVPTDPQDFSAALTKQYDTSLPELKTSINIWVQEWFDTYAPDNDKHLKQLEDKIEQDMNDARAMPDAFETNLYNRARSRAEQERNRTVTDLERGHEKRGFVIPPGSFMAGINKAHQNTADAIAAQSGEISIERAKLEIQHIQFVMQLSTGIRTNLQGLAIQFANTLVSINGQVIQYASLIAQYLTEAYRLLIEKGRLQISVYQVEADVYETELKSALSVLDSYRLELEAERLKKDVESLDVEVYSKLIAAQEAEINKFLALLRGVSEKANIERLAIELYAEQARAFNIRIDGKQAEFNVYRAAIDGDRGKLDGELAKVNIFQAQVESEKTKVEADSTHNNSIIQHNRNLVDQYEAELRAYISEITAESERFKGSVDARRIALETFRVDLETTLSTFRTLLDNERLKLQAQVERMRKDLEIALRNADLLLKSVEIQSDTAIAGAGVHGSIAGNALGSQNTMLSNVITSTA